jgi:hypothetical protein
MPRKTRRRPNIRKKRLTKKRSVGGFNLFNSTADKINEEFKSIEDNIKSYSDLCNYYKEKNHKDFLSVSEDVKTKCENIAKSEEIKAKIAETKNKINILNKTGVNIIDETLIDEYKKTSEKKMAELDNKLVTDKAALDKKLVTDKAALDNKLVTDKAALDKKLVTDKAALDKKLVVDKASITNETDTLITNARTKPLPEKTKLENELIQLNVDLGKIDVLPSRGRLPSTWYRSKESDEAYATRMANQDDMPYEKAYDRYVGFDYGPSDQGYFADETIKYNQAYDDEVREKKLQKQQLQ